MDQSTLFYPSVINYSPTLATLDTSTKPEIKIEFTLKMDSTQFLGDNAALNARILLIHRSTGESVQLSAVGYNETNKILTVTPRTDLLPGELYQVIVSSICKAETGRSLQADFQWNFVVSTMGLAKVLQISPANDTAHEAIPALTWTAVTSAESYDLQLSSTPIFNDSIIPYSTNTTETTATPSPVNLPANNAYFWRVRALTSTTTGAWSDVRSFYYGVAINSSLDSRINSPLAGTFRVVSVTPRDASSNLSAWPTISAQFSDTLDVNSVIDGVINVTYGPVDEDPEGESGIVTGTLGIVGTMLVFTPSGEILPNTRYTVTIAGVKDTYGNVAALTQFYFVGKYTPFYIGNIVLRGDFGQFLTKFSNDFLNFQIYMSSIECNRMMAGDSSSKTLEQLRVPATAITYDMTQYTRDRAAYALLQLKQYELLEEADTQKQLGDFMEKTGASVLTEIGKILKDLKEELKRLEWTLNPDQVKPVTGVRSSQSDATVRTSDQSIATLPGMFKTQF